MESPAVNDWTWDSAWPAPAKLNLFLHVIGRRADGYHLLQTVFRFIDRADTLRFAPRNDGDIVLATPIPGVPADSDLTVRAARLLQQATGCRQGATIHLDKQLPMGGGLGGGSSDAATVLLALNHLWQTGLGRRNWKARPDAGRRRAGLRTWPQHLCRRHRRSLHRCRPAGESYLVLHPDAHVPTAAIFGAPELKRDTPAIRPADWRHGQGNDLEAVACAKFPAVAAALAWLKTKARRR
jgi:4-diphosphocytidyl-2-C-methyl-D-erythritol kinase